MSYLVLVRHGESKWNAVGAWTGLIDISLDEKGKEKAKQGAKLIKDIKFQIAYTSKLLRAKQTLEEIKNQLKLNNLPVIEDVSLNERDYGELTGKNKWEIKEKFGEEQFLKWRRSWDFPIPGGETLKDVYNRVVPFYQKHIFADLKKGKNVLIVAHGNSLRALIKYLENIPDNEVSNFEIATGEIYIYQIDKEGKIVSKEIKNSPASPSEAMPRAGEAGRAELN